MARWVAVLMLSVLAGCASEEVAAPPTSQEPPAENDLPPELRYEPGYKSKTGGYVNGTEAAFYCEAVADSTVKIDVNKTFDGGAHSHDMWKGQDEIVIFESEVNGLSSGNWFATPGAVVHPGASRATFQLDWDQVPGVGDYRYLGVNLPVLQRVSEDRYVDYVLKFTEPGQEHEIEFNFTANDPAHAERTLWSFKMIPANEVTETVGRDGAPGLAYGLAFNRQTTAEMKWTIHRGYDCLPVDPPHYDLWNGTTSRLVVDQTTTHTVTKTPAASSGAFYGLGALEGVVPPGTGTVRATIEWEATEPFVGKLGLEYHAADAKRTSTTTTWRQAVLSSESGNERTYLIDVHPLETDSPYAEFSGWNFRWYFDELGADEVDHAGRFVGDVHWYVEAFKAGYEP